MSNGPDVPRGGANATEGDARSGTRGPSGGGVWHHAEANIVIDGVEYTPEQMFRKRVIERLDEIILLLQGRRP